MQTELASPMIKVLPPHHLILSASILFILLKLDKIEKKWKKKLSERNHEKNIDAKINNCLVSFHKQYEINEAK